MTSSSFRALVARKTNDTVHTSVDEFTLNELPSGDVLVRVSYSDINCKDGLACSSKGRVVRSYPIIPGIDFAGFVVDSTSPKFALGEEVIATGYELGVSKNGGFSEYVRVPAQWLVSLPSGLALRDSMVLGTAGFTAALALHSLQMNGVAPGSGPVIVTGATGGVGSIAIALLSKLGYEVTACTRKKSEAEYLSKLGASRVISSVEISAPSDRALEKETWAGGIDTVGGETLSALIRTMKYRGSVATCGLTGGTAVNTTVFPFILRGVNLLGIDSAYCPMTQRAVIWNRLGKAWHLEKSILDLISTEIGLEQLSEQLNAILEGRLRGRTLVRIGPDG